MRKLGLKDAFALSKMMKSAGVRDEIANLANNIIERQKAGQSISSNEIGIEFFIALIESAGAIEDKFYELYADIKGDTPDNVKNYDLGTVKADIKSLIDDNDLKSFFRSASALM